MNNENLKNFQQGRYFIELLGSVGRLECYSIYLCLQPKKVIPNRSFPPVNVIPIRFHCKREGGC